MLAEAETHYRRLFEHVPIGLYQFTSDGRIIDANPALVRMLDYPDRQSLCSARLTDIYADAEVLGRWQAELERAGVLAAYEAQLRRRDGTLIWMENHGRAVRDSQGAFLYYEGSIQDISGRKAAEERLRESEKLYRLIVETANEGIWLLDPDGVISFINPKGARLIGYAPEEMQGRRAFEFLFPEDHEEAQRRFEARKGGHTAQAEFRALCKDGAEVPILTSSCPVVGEGGEVTGLLGTFVDITERKRAEEALRSSEAKFRALLEQASDGIVVCDFEGNYLQVNARACEMLGYTEAELLSLNARDLVPPEDLASTPLRLDKLRDGKTLLFERRLRRKDGSVFPAEVSAKRVEGGVQSIVRDITERQREQEALRAGREHLALAQRVAGIGSFDWDLRTGAAVFSAELETLYGVPPGGGDGRYETWLKYAHPDDLPAVWRAMEESLRTGVLDAEFRVVRPDGAVRWMRGSGRVFYDREGEPERLVGVNMDVTERKQLEEQFRQSQRMEAVGRLAAGVAHDFNNLLTAITGYSDLALLRLRPGNPLHHMIQEIKRAGERAAALTRQLLAFSRKQVLQPKVIDLNALITEMTSMLGRLLGEDVELSTDLDPALGLVRADAGQLEQVITNLAVNARDAMPSGGRLFIQTSNVMMDEAVAREYESVRSGPHVLLTVSDTGHGMDPETQSRAFEPFFTTKEVGKGTGLGLSTVYGIVKQSEGYVSLHSEVGRGTTFRVYLPRVDERVERVEHASEPPELPKGGETVLLVEDEDLVRGIAKVTLEMSGYEVLAAANAGEALLVCERRGCEIDLLLTDVVMPGGSGRELAERLRGMRPRMKVIFMSGYTEDAIRHHGVLEEGTEFIEKPFTPDALAQKVRQVLDGLGN